MSKSSRKVVLVVAGSLVVLVVVGVLLAKGEDLMPLEQATELSAIEPYGVGRSVRFVRWEGPKPRGDGSAVVRAIYADGDEELGFELLVLADPAAARELFRSERADLLTWDEEIQQINTFAESEYCARLGNRLRCVGFLEGKPLYFMSSGTTGEDDFDVLALLRTARKHWFRVYS